MNRIRRWWRRRRAARHEPSCPAAFAFIPTWAIASAATPRENRVQIYHPPAPCAGCPAVITWSTRDQRSQRGKLYCTVECRHHAGNPPSSRPAPVAKPCPRPDKEALSSRVEAEARFHTLLVTDPTFEVYRCICLAWHGGHPRSRVDNAQRVRNIARITNWGRSA